MEYTRYPPVEEEGETLSIALRMSCFCKWESRVKSRCDLLVFTEASLLITPVPEQGASRRTLSNPPITFGKSRPSWLQTMTLLFLHGRDRKAGEQQKYNEGQSTTTKSAKWGCQEK